MVGTGLCRLVILCFALYSLEVTQLIPIYSELSECAKDQPDSLNTNTGSLNSVPDHKELPVHYRTDGF